MEFLLFDLLYLLIISKKSSFKKFGLQFSRFPVSNLVNSRKKNKYNFQFEGFLKKEKKLFF